MSAADTAPASTELVAGLEFPEGPVWCSDGSVLLVEIHRGTVTRIRDGNAEVVAKAGAGPNGLAVGPDHRLYVCDNGGFEWDVRPGRYLPGLQPATYIGGAVLRVDPAAGACETAVSGVGGRRLRGPNDLIFDAAGGCWFTDMGKTRQYDRDLGGLYYMRPTGDVIEAVFPLDGGPNGVALSPDKSKVYVAETWTGRVFFWELDGPGRIKRNPRAANGGYYLATAENGQALDSMAMDVEGNACVATPGHEAGITIFAPDGRQRLVPTGDPMTTNICFGGDGRETAFITLSLSGRLVAMPWEVPGLELAFNL